MTVGFGQAGSSADIALIGGKDDLQTRRITLLAGQFLNRGALLGKITASGKYVLSASALSNGAQIPAVILAEDTNATSGDRETVAYFGGVFDENAVMYGAGHSPASVRETLRDIGIKLQPSM